MNWSNCPCCGNPCQLLFISAECITPSCQNFSAPLLSKYETLQGQKNNSMTHPEEDYDEDYGYPLYSSWYQQDTD